MNSTWISYHGKKILYCDYRNLGTGDLDTLRAELAYVADLLKNEPGKSALSITDVRGSIASMEAVNAMKEAAVSTGKHVKAQAVVGVTGLKKVFFDAIVRISGQTARTFDDVESAQDWLVNLN